MLPYVSIFEYIHKQVEHNINTQESILEVYKEYKNIVNSPHLTDKVFIEVINNYFYDANIKYSSLTALKEQKQQVGFKVRATKDALIVIEVTDDLRFVVGDEITALSGDGIEYCRKRYHRILGEEPYHREDWHHILTLQNDVDINRSHQSYHFELKKYIFKEEAQIRIYERDEIPIVNIKGNNSFEQTIDALYQLSKIKSSRIIFDVRNANFDRLSIAEFLIPYFYEVGLRSQVRTNEAQVETTIEKHTNLFIRKLEKLYKESEEMNEQAFYQNIIDQTEGNWQYFDDNQIEFTGLSRFEDITIIIDKDTEMAAEWFVQKVQNSNIVNVIGRPTKGDLSYMDLVEEKIDQRFLLSYPVYNLKRKNYDSMVYPNELIEWSKRHALYDYDIKFAINNRC